MNKQIIVLALLGCAFTWGCDARPAKSKDSKNSPAASEAKSNEATSGDKAVAEPELSTTHKELNAFVDEFVAAFKRRDAKAIASMWAKAGVHHDRPTGTVSEGREQIEKFYSQLFEKNRGALLLTLEQVREVAPNVAKAEAAVSFLADEEEQPTSDSHLSALFVKEDGKWRLESVHETILAPVTGPLVQLQPLAWLVGQWQDETGDVEIKSDCQWAVGGGFLTRSYTIKFKGQLQHQGTQVIGWNPESQKIQSWNFESNGSYGQGEWTQNGNQWTIKLRGLTPDGQRASGKQIITQIDENTFTTQLISRDVAGEMLPTGKVVKVVRLKAAQ